MSFSQELQNYFFESFWGHCRVLHDTSGKILNFSRVSEENTGEFLLNFCWISEKIHKTKNSGNFWTFSSISCRKIFGSTFLFPQNFKEKLYLNLGWQKSQIHKTKISEDLVRENIKKETNHLGLAILKHELFSNISRKYSSNFKLIPQNFKQQNYLNFVRQKSKVHNTATSENWVHEN